MPIASRNARSTDKYDAFLSASIAEQENGTPVSVLSALIRGNYDPWQEAARLAELPPDRAKWALAEILNKILDRRWSLAESEDLAKHLVRLLPCAGTSAAPRPQAANSPNGAPVVVYWAFWIVFLLLTSLSQPRDRMLSTSTGRTAGASVKQLSQNPGMRNAVHFEKSKAQSFEAMRSDVE